MPDWTRYFDPQTLAKLDSLTLRADQMVDGYRAGLHRSLLRGLSLEFTEHRQYSPGDDPRYIDWKVYGRTDRYFLKQFEHEANRTVWLVLDSSESMDYQGPGAPMSKWRYAQCLMVAVGWLVLHQHDALGLMVFSDDVRYWLHPGRQPDYLSALIDAVEPVQPSGRTAVSEVIRQLVDRTQPGGAVLLISDLLTDVPALLSSLQRLKHARQEVFVLHVLDPAEVCFPFNRWMAFRGLEGGPRTVVDAGSVRATYLAQFQHYQRQLSHGCWQNGIRYQLVQTDERIDIVMARFASPRRTEHAF